MKKFIILIVRVIATAIVYGCVLWLFNAIFDGDRAIDSGLIVQSLLFSILLVAWTRWSERKKVSKPSENPS